MLHWGFNRTLGQAPILMSLIACGPVVFGGMTEQTITLSGKSTLDLIFQVLLFGQPLLIAGFVLSAGWKRPLRTVTLLLLQASALGLTLATSWRFDSRPA